MMLYRIALVLFMLNTVVNAQDTYSQRTPVELDGPRVGVTFLTGEVAQVLQDEFNVIPIISQFGWQVEKQFFVLPTGTTGLVEFVGLIGGLEQGIFLPSLTSLIGIRSGTGTEFGVGPNLSVSGFSMAFAAGINIQRYGVNFPINLAFVPARSGARFSVLFGFNAISPEQRRGLRR